jgi:hypothetical protein
MGKLIISVAGAALIAMTLPASAQRFEVEGPGVGVRVGDGHHHWRERHGHDCRTVIIKRRNAAGDLVVKKIRRCD